MKTISLSKSDAKKLIKYLFMCSCEGNDSDYRFYIKIANEIRQTFKIPEEYKLFNGEFVKIVQKELSPKYFLDTYIPF